MGRHSTSSSTSTSTSHSEPSTKTKTKEKREHCNSSTSTSTSDSDTSHSNSNKKHHMHMHRDRSGSESEEIERVQRKKDKKHKSAKQRSRSSEDERDGDRSRRRGCDSDGRRDGKTSDRPSSGSRSERSKRYYRGEDGEKLNSQREEDGRDFYGDRKKWKNDERYGGPSQRRDDRDYEDRRRPPRKYKDDADYYGDDRQYRKRHDRKNENAQYGRGEEREEEEGYSPNGRRTQRSKREHSPPPEKHRPDKRSRTDFQRDKKKPNYRKESGSDQQNYDWGKKTEDNKPGVKTEKEKPNFGLSGKLTEDQNTVNGVVIKYAEPPEARKPKRRWRLYPFKGEQALPIMYLHRQSGFLIGRDRKVADLPLDHPSISKQHAALQYRLVPFKREDGSTGKRIRPYVIDLESANGTFVNNNKIEPRKYVELLERDVIKFGFSQREYVLLHENSKDDETDDDDDVNVSESLISLVKDEPL